jgi:hypothetical protein
MSYLPVTDEQVRRRGKLWSVVAAVAIVLNLVILAGCYGCFVSGVQCALS